MIVIKDKQTTIDRLKMLIEKGYGMTNKPFSKKRVNELVKKLRELEDKTNE